MLTLTKRIAESEGFEVIVCTVVRRRSSWRKSGARTSIMVDLRMPDVNGLDIVRALRKTDTNATIVLMTGYASIDSAVEAVKVGAADYLTKPFDMERLKGRSRWCGTKPSGARG